MATTLNGTPYVESSDLVANYPAISLALANKIDSFAKIRQVVRATDATGRSTTSTSFVDASISVTITPTRNTSTILLLWVARAQILGSGSNGNFRGQLRITDSANVAQSGSQEGTYGYVASTGLTDATLYHHIALVGWASPATLSAVTYKGQFRVLAGSNTNTIDNANNTGQLYAIEVAA
jgi:hypothetical protein